MVELAVSTFGLHANLGPIRLSRRDDAGNRVPFVWEQPQTLSLLEFPRQVRERLDIRQVEICQFHIPSLERSYLDQLKQALSDAGVTVANIPIDVGNISAAREDFRESDLQEIERWIDVAAYLGSPMVRVNASAPMSQEALGPIEVTIASYRRLAAYAATQGVTMLIENHGGITADPETIVQIVRSVGPDVLKTCVDVGNFEPVMSAQMRGLAPGSYDPSPLYTGLAMIAPYAGMLHAKTMSFDEHGQHVGWDVVKALRIVLDAGYHGVVSLEYGGGQDEWNNTLRTKQLVKEAIHGDGAQA